MAPSSSAGWLRPFAILLVLAAYLLAFATASGITPSPDVEKRQLLGGLPFDVPTKNDDKPSFSGDDGFGDRRGGSDSSSSDEDTSASPPPQGFSPRFQCSSSTPAGILWIGKAGFTCAPVLGQSGKNYCISSTLHELNDAQSFCDKHADCGSGQWCILVSGQSKSCWALAEGCDNYYQGGGIEL